MSIFGQLDAAAISSNSFKVDAGEYTAEVTQAEITTVKSGKNQGRRQLHIEYTINDEESLFNESRLHHYLIMVDEDMTAEKFSLLPVEEQRDIMKSNAKLKQVLCGNDGRKDQPGLGVNPEDLNDPDWEIKSIIGTKVSVVVTNWGANNENVNIRWVNKIDE